MKADSGKLNQKVTIHSFANGDDEYGGSIPVQSIYWETFANVVPMSSYELTQTGKTDLKGGFKFTLRYRTDKTVTTDMLLKYRGEYMEIISALQDYVTKETVLIKAIWNNRPIGGE